MRSDSLGLVVRSRRRRRRAELPIYCQFTANCRRHRPRRACAEPGVADGLTCVRFSAAAAAPSNHIIVPWDGQKRPSAFWAGITTISRLTRRAAPAPEARRRGGGEALNIKDQFLIALLGLLAKTKGKAIARAETRLEGGSEHRERGGADTPLHAPRSALTPDCTRVEFAAGAPARRESMMSGLCPCPETRAEPGAWPGRATRDV